VSKIHHNNGSQCADKQSCTDRNGFSEKQQSACSHFQYTGKYLIPRHDSKRKPKNLLCGEITIVGVQNPQRRIGHLYRKKFCKTKTDNTQTCYISPDNIVPIKHHVVLYPHIL